MVTQFRLRVVFFLIPFFALLIVMRLFYWQIIRGPGLAERADRQHQEVVVLAGERGDILDSSGELLAGTQNLYHLFVYQPQLEKDKAAVIDLLAPVLAPDPPEASPGAKVVTEADMLAQTRSLLLDRLNLTSNWVSLKHYLTPDQKKTIEALNLKGLGFEDEFTRFYPEASLAAQVLGFVGSDLAGEPQGYFGLEGYFDRQMHGREGKIRSEKDAFGNPILIGRYNLLSSITGRSIVTTIHKQTQFLVESLLRDGLTRYQAKAGNVIIMESATGKILAMAAYPNYDPGHFADFDKSTYKNPSVANLFEPGSIFKVLVMAAALNEKVVTPATTCDICTGPIRIGQYTIKTWNEKYYPDSSLTDVIVHSDNIGMVFTARLLGKEKFARYLADFGLGQLTGIELQEEASGPKRLPTDLKDIDLATNSFGQGIAVTPIQMLTAVNAIANKGVLIRPTIVEKIISGDKEVSLPQTKKTKVIEPETATQIRDMMIAAVNRGEAKWARSKNIEIAGKTGTAQIPISGHYDPTKTIASFVGFFPARRPQYTMLVSLTEPQTSPWGSETAAPLWFAIANQLLLLGISRY
ncbi:MAG: penicillin-binding protein 2 [Patescibacteria group bacterium]